MASSSTSEAPTTRAQRSRASSRRAGHSRASARVERARARSTKRASAVSRATTSTPARAASRSACTRRSSRFAIRRSACSVRCSSLAMDEAQEPLAATPTPVRDDRRRVRPHRASAHRSRDRRDARLRRRPAQPRRIGEPNRKTSSSTTAASSPKSIPLFGFYLQPAVGGRVLSYRFWREFAEIPNVWAIKIAPFNRYQTIDVVRAVVEAGRDDIALYTGNDDNIVADLLTPFPVHVGGTTVVRWIDGGLLGQWAVWTRAAVAMLAALKTRARHRRVRADAALARRRAHRRERRRVRRRATDSPAAFRVFTKCCVVRDCSTASGASIRTRRCRRDRRTRSRASSGAIPRSRTTSCHPERALRRWRSSGRCERRIHRPLFEMTPGA